MRQFFYPSAIAVFGVSTGPANLAKNIIHNCLEMGFEGKIYPVGKNPGTVCGRDIITEPTTLPEGIDLAVILIPAYLVAKTLDICGRKGIRHVIVSTGGYSEFDKGNNYAERDLLKTARRYGIRFIGPNCIGIINTGSGLCTPFNPINTKNYKKGFVSIIAQSGGIANQTAHYFSEEHIGFAKIISAGNKLDMDELDFIEYLMGDEDTGQIHLYLESIDNGRQLMRMARRSSKPIVLLKSNVSRMASEVAKSHTAALSNNDRIVESAIKQAGIIRVQSIHEMTVCAKALRLPPLKGDRLVAISLSGGFSVILGDACEKYGFKCPALPEPLIRKIESFRRGGVIRMANPMDFGDIHSIEALIFTLEQCLALDDIDGIALSFMYGPTMAKMIGEEIAQPDKLLDLFQKISDGAGKPIGLSFFSERRHIEQLKAIDSFPVFNDPVESVQALSMLRDYTLREINHGESKSENDLKYGEKMKIIDEAIKRGQTILSEYESKQLLAYYGIPVTKEVLVGNRESLMAAIEEIGFPVVLKGCSPDISHKTERGLIRVDIRNEDEASESFKEIIAGMSGPENYVLVQEMIRGKRELVAGLTRDPQFGPCVMFGLGGIFTEILKDISFRVAPLKKYDALEMMQEIKGHKILGAVRGMEAADMEMLADILITIGKIGMENENIKEIDINPLIISGNKLVAVDALVVLESLPAHG